MSRPIKPLFLFLAIAVAAACDKVPLLAPTQSTITLTLSTTTLPINGTAQVIATVIEQAGTPVHNGTTVTFTGSLGTFDPAEATTVNGKATTTFRATGQSGIAKIGAVSGGAKATEIEIRIGGAAAERVTLRAEPANVPVTGGRVTLIAVVTDASGNPLGGAPVVFSADNGQLSSNSVVSDATGEARVELTTQRDTIVRATVGAKEGTVTVRSVALPAVTITPSANPIVGAAAIFTIANAGGSTANPIANVSIDFGDGEPAQNIGPVPATGSVATQHVYRSGGTFTVRATVRDSTGLTGESSTVVTVQRVTPTLTVTASPSTGSVGQVITATITITNPQNIAVRSLVVRWGDGRETALGAPQSGSTTATRQYSERGNYTITAVLVDANGSEVTASTSVVIQPREAVEVDFTHTPPGLFNTRHTFTVTQPPTSSGVANYTWDFEDGTPRETTTNRTIEHNFSRNGTFNVTLTVTMVNGGVFSRTKAIRVQ